MDRDSTRCLAPVLCGLAIAVALPCCLAASAHAQSIWLDRDHHASGMLEVLFPGFDGGDTKFPDWTWFAAGRFRVGPRTHFVAELPYTHADFGNGTAGVSEGTLGNPYVGLEYAPGTSGAYVDFGVRIPVASDTKDLAFVNGYLSDLDRQEAFIPDALPVRLAVHGHHVARAVGGVSWDLRLAPIVWIKTSDKVLNETETFLVYGGTLRYEGESVRVGGGLTGRWNLSSNGADLAESTLHEAEFAADFLKGSVRPGVQLKLPIDHDLSQVLNQSWGFTLTVLPRTGP